MTSRRSNTIVLVVGAVTAVVATVLAGLPASDAVTLLAISFGVAIGAYALGRVAMPAARRWRGIGAAAAVTALIPVASVVAGAVAAARAMFVSAHDLSALVVIVVGSATAGLLGALALARELASARREADLQAARAQRLDASRRQLVAWVSHDLRTPLAGIRAMVEALDDGVVSDPPTVARYHRQMIDEVDHLARLVDDLFELSRIEADALQLKLEPVALDEIVSDAVASARVLATAKGVHIDGGDAPVPPVRASTPELTRVLRNLLDNAIRHTPAGGAIDVRVRDDGDAVVVSVRDQCGGIPDDEIGRVFDAAFRGDEARTPGGAGLGLAIARGFVEAHRGAIDVLNHDDGCCFSVRLPHASRR